MLFRQAYFQQAALQQRAVLTAVATGQYAALGVGMDVLGLPAPLGLRVAYDVPEQIKAREKAKALEG